MLTSFLHGYPPHWSMGGEISTHRTLREIPGSTVYADVPEEYEFEGVQVVPFESKLYEDVLSAASNASLLFAHSSMSAVTVRAARRLGVPSILSVHAPPRYATDLRRAWSRATARIYNTEAARKSWNDPKGWVLHPPMGTPKPAKSKSRDALTLTSSLLNKGVKQVLQLAKERPEQRFIIIESPAHPTHGSPDFAETAAALPNVEVWPRIHPNDMNTVWAETKILLVPSMYETYGLSAVEAAWHGIPSIHVDTAHVREGIGTAARLLRGHTVLELDQAVTEVEQDYNHWADQAYLRAEYLHSREKDELALLPAWVRALTTP